MCVLVRESGTFEAFAFGCRACGRLMRRRFTPNDSSPSTAQSGQPGRRNTEGQIRAAFFLHFQMYSQQNYCKDILGILPWIF